MTTALRALEPRDHDAVLHLNAAYVDLLAPLPPERLAQLVEWSDRFDVIDVEGEVAGFVVTFAPGSPYDSANYVEFARRFGDGFYYLDRIVVDDRWRRKGLAAFVYDELERVAAPYGRMVLEVNSEPANVPSLRFHEARGYAGLGELGEPDGKRVLLMVKEMVR